MTVDYALFWKSYGPAANERHQGCGPICYFCFRSSGLSGFSEECRTNPAVTTQRMPQPSFQGKIRWNSHFLLSSGQQIFRFDTFGSERFWGDQLRLHEAILGEKLGGVGPGLTPKQALELGLKVDAGLLPRILFEALRGGSVSLEDPKTTVELLRANSVVGVTGFFEQGKLRSDWDSVRTVPFDRGQLVCPRHRTTAGRLAEP